MRATGNCTVSYEPSPDQLEIIQHRGGHLQVIACAGAGKTEAVSRRVAELIVEGVEPQAIVAFTFTDRAAASMKARIVLRVLERLGPDVVERLGPMYVGTIHSYCLRLLQQHVPEYANFDIVDEHRHAALLSREFRRLDLDGIGERHWEPIAQFVRNAEALENELIEHAGLSRTEFGKRYGEYRAMLKRYRLLSYGQLITTAVEALSKPAVFQEVRGRLRHLIVDEYQDINPAQEELIRLLAQPPVSLCVVGDDDQAIYQWRGSDVGNILRFVQRYNGASTLPLSTNRRSRPDIIERANRFAESIQPRLEKSMEKKREAGGPEVFCWSAETAAEEAVLIAETIERLAERGYRYRDIGILLRSVRTSSPPILDALGRRGIPARCAGRTGLFLQPEPQAFGMTYAWLGGGLWKAARYGTPADVALGDLIREYRRMFDLSQEEGAVLRERLESWRRAAASDEEPANLVRDYYALLRRLKVHGWDIDDPVNYARLGTLARFSELLADFEHVRRRARWVEESGNLVYSGGESRGPSYYRSLFNYMQHYALEAYEDFEGEETFRADAVDVLTVHQAKGLEWPVVFLPALVEGRFPSSLAGRQEDWLLPEPVFGMEARRRYEGGETDERRLFYVAMTRARDMLYLSRFRRAWNRRRASPFLVEVAGLDPPVVDALPLPPPHEPGGTEERERPSLAFSDVVAYENCPLGYRLSTLLGFQPQLVAELGYGKAMHHILRRLAELVREKRVLPSEGEIAALFQEGFHLPFANRFAFERLRREAGRLVRRYLCAHSEDLSRVWATERPFELHLGNGVLTGRADVILDGEGGRPGSMAIMDYKTSTEGEADAHRFQLAIYAAAGRAEGMDVRAGYVHDLARGERVPVAVDEGSAAAARLRAQKALASIANRQFPPKRGRRCASCDVRFVCRHGPVR